MRTLIARLPFVRLFNPDTVEAYRRIALRFVIDDRSGPVGGFIERCLGNEIGRPFQPVDLVGPAVDGDFPAIDLKQG